MRRAGSVESPLGGNFSVSGDRFVAVGCYVGPVGFACDLKQWWRINFGRQPYESWQPGETSDDGFHKIVHHVATTVYVLWILGGPSWLLFELSCQMCTFIFGFVGASHEVIAPFPQVLFFKITSLAYLNPQTKNSESFPRWRCASCDLLFVLMEILGWKIQPCYIIVVGNLPTSTGKRHVSEPSVWAIEDGSFCHGVQRLGGRSDTFQGIWPRRSVVFDGEDDAQISWRKVALRNAGVGVT